MDFRYTEEQQMLADTVGRFIDKEYDFETRKRLVACAAGFSEEHWKLFAELGLLGLVVPEEFGGMGATPVETMIVMEALGRGLVVEPYLSTAVVGAFLVSSAGSPAQKAAILPGIVEGSRRLALAAFEPGARFDLWDVRTVAVPCCDSVHRVSGRKAVVLHGDSADAFVVSARTTGALDDRHGITLFLVDAGAPGMSVMPSMNIDGHRSAEVTLDSVRVDTSTMLGPMGAGYPVLEAAVDRGIAALCAEAVGAMSRLLDMTVDYLRLRKQFGRPLGDFQVLQHRTADMFTAIEQARSAALMAAARADDPDRVRRRQAISAAKATIGRSGRAVGEAAIQLHGGMGMTDDLPVGHYFKRLTCIDMTWGNWQHHVELYGELM